MDLIWTCLKQSRPTLHCSLYCQSCSYINVREIPTIIIVAELLVHCCSFDCLGLLGLVVGIPLDRFSCGHSHYLDLLFCVLLRGNILTHNATNILTHNATNPRSKLCIGGPPPLLIHQSLACITTLTSNSLEQANAQVVEAITKQDWDAINPQHWAQFDIKVRILHLTMMDFALKMMNFAFKIMKFHLN